MSLHETPLISIVIPVYNGANYLREAIDSALAQTYTNIEVIVVDDGSTDDGATQAIALSYHEKIRYFRKENGGVSSALNFGIQHMKGEYFAWLSHDDIHYPQKTEKQVRAILEHQGTRPVICVCNYILVDKDGREITRSPENLDQYFRRSPNCFFGGETTLMIDGDATLISKQVFDTCGLFDESLFASQETDMWYRSLNTADFVFISDYLVGYRTHPQQVTNKRKVSVGIEAGAYRGNLIKQATLQEVQTYYCSKQDAFRMGTATYSYMSLLFYEAAHQAVGKLRQLAQLDWKYTYQALAGMFDPLNIKEIQSLLQADIAKASHKKKILIYCMHWDAEGQHHRIAPLIKGLQNDFEFILVYGGQSSNAVPPNVPSICLGQSNPWLPDYHATRLALLAELFQVDILWLNAVNFMPMATAISYLKGSAIRTVASFHFEEPTANTFEDIMIDESGESPLADATILTHEQHDFMFTHYVYPYDAIFLPTMQSDSTVLEKWRLLFHSLLSSQESKAEIRRHFTLIDGSHEALKPMEIIERIKPYLEKYEAFELDKHRVYYEESFSWKITKPLRVIADLARKLVGHAR